MLLIVAEVISYIAYSFEFEEDSVELARVFQPEDSMWF